jgi:hypothetical protein
LGHTHAFAGATDQFANYFRIVFHSLNEMLPCGNIATIIGQIKRIIPEREQKVFERQNMKFIFPFGNIN